MHWIIVWIFVADAVAEFFCAGIMAVAQVLWHGAVFAVAHVGQSTLNAHVGTVALRRGGHVGDSLAEDDATFWHAYELQRVGGALCDHQRLRIGHADVFTGEDNDAASDEERIFTGVEHAREIIEGCVDVAAAHAFDESGDDIVMFVAGAVVAHCWTLDAFLGDGEIDVDGTIFVCRA